ncbi:Retrovirus-related Pol polyprotein from transposon 297, partial [Stegodyphus mimosarum]
MDKIQEENVAVPEVDLSHLEEGERAKIQELVRTFSNLFDEKPGFCQIVSHSIDTGNEPPVRSKPYRYDRVKEDILEQHIKKMLEDKIITPSTSPYASPVVLCRKKNGLQPQIRKRGDSPSFIGS